jgi:hypothetical protein
MKTEIAWAIKHSSNDESSMNVTCFIYQLVWVSYRRSSESLLCLSEKTSSAHMQGKNFTLKQAMKAKKGIRVLLFLQTRTLDGVGSQHHVPAPLSPGKGPATHFTGGWGSQGRSGRMRKISRQPGWIPGQSSLQWVAILTATMQGAPLIRHVDLSPVGKGRIFCTLPDIFHCIFKIFLDLN